MQYWERIRAARQAQGLTLDKLASRAGITKMHLWCIEKGRRGAGAAAIVRLAEALGLDPIAELHASGALRKKKSAAPKRPSRATAQKPHGTAAGDAKVPMTAESLSQAGGGKQGETE